MVTNKTTFYKIQRNAYVQNYLVYTGNRQNYTES